MGSRASLGIVGKKNLFPLQRFEHLLLESYETHKNTLWVDAEFLNIRTGGVCVYIYIYIYIVTTVL
jgi:hypothetical protein